MYSSDADDDNLMSKWRETYKRFYGETSVKIYQRDDFMQKGRVNIIDEIENMFD